MSIAFEHFSDVKIIECSDFLSVLPSLVTTGNILLVTSKGFTKRGLVAQVVDKLGTSRVHVFDDVTPNPEKEHLQTNITQFAQNKIEHVIALGGGSAIDAAKVFCGLLSLSDNSIDDLILADDVKNRINLIAIPTTSGTGAEVTPFATVWESETNSKFSVYGILPNTAILAPNLTVTLSYVDTLYPALDALSHALESLWNKNRTLESETYAIQAVEGVCEALPKVLEQPQNLVARKILQQAATFAGLAISQTKTAIAHAISYPLTVKYGVPHGLACSFTLAAIVREVGGKKLNLSPALVDSTLTLLDKLALEREMTKFVDWQTLLEQFDPTVDPSRAGNFVVSIDSDWLAAIIRKSRQPKFSGEVHET